VGFFFWLAGLGWLDRWCFGEVAMIIDMCGGQLFNYRDIYLSRTFANLFIIFCIIVLTLMVTIAEKSLKVGLKKLVEPS
jgi:preprotein translocase subunit SecG